MAVAELHTPKIPPHQSSPRNSLSKEIEQLKSTIASTEKYLISLQEGIKLIRNQFAAASDPTLATAIMQQMTLETRVMHMTRGQLGTYWARLEKVKEKFRRAEEEVEKSVRVSPKNTIQTGLGEEGPDSGYVVDIDKFQCMKQWLDQERVLLLRSPPCSGKTSFAVRFADHLIDAGYSVKYMSAALGENQPDDETSVDNIWENTIGYTFSQFCKSREKPFYLIVDEAQIWYPMNVAMKAGKELVNFWHEVKTLLKSGRDFSSYIDARSDGASTPAAALMSTVPVRLLCLAGYGEANLGTAATPLTFVDPVDPVTNLPSPLGLDFLRFNREKTHELISKYTKIKALEGKMTSFSTDSAVCDLIFQRTNGHVGAIRTFLFHVTRAGKKTKDDVIEFISSPKSRIELTVYRPFLSVSAETIQRLTPKDIALLLRCIASYKRGNHFIPVNILTADVLIKLGIFVRAGLETLAFPSPLHFDVTLHNMQGHHHQVELEQTRPSFEGADQHHEAHKTED